MERLIGLTALSGAALLLAASWAYADENAGRDACVNQLRTVGGPDAQNGIDVLDTDWSQAGTMVTMRDAGGTVWSCIGYDDGTIGDLTATDAADDGGGAMAGNTASEGPESDGGTETTTVRFAAGASGATYDGSLNPGGSMRYVLGANENQFLDVRVAPDGPGISYQIFNPDGSFLLEMTDPDKPYRGQLWQSGGHVVEVINRGGGTTGFRVEFSIE